MWLGGDDNCRSWRSDVWMCCYTGDVLDMLVCISRGK
jgi:hypothetical protein